MWALLSDPGHARNFDHLGEAYTPLRQLIEHLATREYAGEVYAFESAASFNLSTAPTREQSAGHEGIGIEYEPDAGAFRVGYHERSAPARRARVRSSPARACDPDEVGEIIDHYVARMLQARPPAPVKTTAAENVLIAALFLGMFAFLGLWLLGWTGLDVGRPAAACMGVVGVALGLLSLGQALLPGWERPKWRPPRIGRATVRMGRLVLLGTGLWFGAIGAVLLWVIVVGEPPKPVAWVLLGVLPVAVVLFLIGLKQDRRRLEAAWALEDAQRGGSGVAE